MRMQILWAGCHFLIVQTVNKVDHLRSTTSMVLANPTLGNVDFASPMEAKMFLIVIDAHSNWIEVFPMATVTAMTTIQWLRQLFAQFGISQSIVAKNEMYLATPNFSLFVLELPFPNRKAEVKFQYLFWNFRSQIEKRKPIGQNKLSLATAPFFTLRFGISVPRSKRESWFATICSGTNRKAGHHSFWNSPSKSKRGR